MGKDKLKPKWHTRLGLELGVARYDLPGRFIKDKLVLDVACGDGIGTAYLSSQGARAVCGGDISIDSLCHARLLSGGENSFTALDACALPFRDGAFDVVVSIETIEHIQKQEEYLGECRRVLKEGGYFICSTVNRDRFSHGRDNPWFPGHVKELNTQEFCQLLARYFHQIELYGLPFTEKYGTFGKFIYRHEDLLVNFLLSRSLSRRAIQPVIGWLFPRYHLINLDHASNIDLGQYSNRKYQAFPLDGSKANPMFIIAMAKK